MSVETFRNNLNNPATLFAGGFLLVMLTLWVPFIPDWPTFIHMWRVELAASIFLLVSLFYIVLADRPLLSAISRGELTFIIFPILVFIIWSALSMSWSPSWKSALHHTLIWSEYLIFYLIARQLIERKTNYYVMLSIFAITFVVFSVPAIIDYCGYLIFGGSTRLGIRFAKYGEQVNTFFPILIIGVLHLKRRRFAFGLSALAVIWLLVFCSLGRMNLILFAIGILNVTALVLIFKRFHKFRRKMMIVVGVLILIPLPMHAFTFLADEANLPMFRRFSDDEGMTSSNNFRKLMAVLSLEMFKAHPLIGVGADNFGMQVSNYRAVYGAQNPDDINLATAEDELPERSHNEYLQILAELGLVGGLIFLWFMSGIALMAFNVLRRHGGLIPIAALIGLSLFLASSLVSSYSFRFIQNGFVFFFVLAIAAKFSLNTKENNKERTSIPVSQLQFAGVLGISACLSLAAYSVLRVSSVYYAERANYEPVIEKALPLYQKAFLFDDENANAHYHLGNRFFYAARYAEAATHLKRSIEMGQAGSPTHSYLATAQLFSGDASAAENTFANAVRLYPQSPFVLTRYAFLLKMNEKSAESSIQLERAFQIKKNAATTWWTIMNEGTQKASDNAIKNVDLYGIMDLKPKDAIYAVITERRLRFPAEERKLPF